MMLCKIMLCYKTMFNGAFTLGVKESSIMSTNTKLVISNLNLFTSKILC
jgi:hypothetical protein